jgi:hypothetical protein
MELTQTTVTTTAKSIVSENLNRRYLTIEVKSADLYIGDSSSVSSTSGFLISTGDTLELVNYVPQAEVFAITSSGTAYVYVTDGD